MNYWELRKRYPGEPPWWLINGVTNANVLGAWKFKKRNSAAEALKDLTGHGNTLTNNSCSWSAANGFTVTMDNRNSVVTHYLDNSTVRNSCKSIVMKINGSGVSNGAALPLSGGWSGIGLWLNTPIATQAFWYDVTGKPGISHSNGKNSSTTGDGTLSRNDVQLVTSDNFRSSETIGFTKSGEGIYRNGSAASKAVATYSDHGEWTLFSCANVPRLVGGVPLLFDESAAWDSAAHWVMAGSFTIQAMACYNVDLSASQQADAYKNMIFI